MPRFRLLYLSVLIISLFTQILHAETYQVYLTAGDYEIIDLADGYQNIEMKGMGQLLIPGKPKLPSKIFYIAIPPDAIVTEIRIAREGAVELDGYYNIEPASAALPGNGDAAATQNAWDTYNLNYQEVYSSASVYPAIVRDEVKQGGYCSYNIVEVRFTPFDYYPQTQKLVSYSGAAVEIDYDMPASQYAAGSPRCIQAEVEQRAQELLVNYDDAQGWFGPSISCWCII